MFTEKVEMEKPKMEVIEFDANDSIVTSGTGGGGACFGSAADCDSYESVMEDTK